MKRWRKRISTLACYLFAAGAFLLIFMIIGTAGAIETDNLSLSAGTITMVKDGAAFIACVLLSRISALCGEEE